jgi:A/G-specific adenine glycosylase
MDVAALLAWYRASRRRLPWREEVSPYRTLVSELMLQQTRVETVLPYFARFLSSFPTVEALAAAPLERVLEHWSGLGYYSRARNLHAAACAVVAAGGFPTTLDGLRALPGVGPYTAGAVASIALGLDAPLVDGNVERVLCRQLALAEDPRRIRARLWAEATRLLPRGEAGDWNQALMELGATVCVPVKPRCLLCPVRASCAGVGDPERYPRKEPKAEVPVAEAVAAVVAEEGRLLLARRPDAGLLGGLWEPPGGQGSDLAAVLLARVGVRVVDAAPLGRVTHVFSHLRLNTTVYAARVEGALVLSGYQDARWIVRPEVDGMALSTLARKVLRLEA